MKPIKIEVAAGTPPDDLLFAPVIDPAGNIKVIFQEGFIGEEALRDYAELSKHLTRSEMVVQGEDGRIYWTGGTHLLEGEVETDESDFEIHMEASDSYSPLWGCGGYKAGPHSFLYVVRQQIVRPELIRDFNEVSDSLKLHSRISHRPKISMLDLLDREDHA